MPNLKSRHAWQVALLMTSSSILGAPPGAFFDPERQRLTLSDGAGEPWLINAFARVRFTNGVTVHTSDKRYETDVVTPAGRTIVTFSDRQSILDLVWTLDLLDGRSCTAQLALHNRGAVTLRLERLDVLVGRLTEQGDPDRRHILQNGFVLSPPHPTERKPDTDVVSSYETLAIESPPLASGWLTGKHNFGHVDARELNGKPVVFAWGECNSCTLPPGATRTSDLFFISTQAHPLEQMERFASLAGEINRAVIWPPRIAWCTWYAGWQRKQIATYKGGMEKGIEAMVPHVAETFAGRGAKTMRICDDFIDYGDWPNKTKALPGGFERLATLISEAGLTPGVWYAPYWARSDANVLAEHPEWFARDKKGHIWFETGWQPKSRDTTKFAVFDTSRPDVVEYFEETARRWRERGFRYVSTDFLNWALKPDRYHDPTKTRAEVLHAGMAAIRRGLGADVFYRPINNPLGVAMGIANDTRISGDSHGNNPTAFFRTAEVWFYNRRLWLTDPSAIVCARYGKLRDLRWNRMWMSWMALAGTVLTYGEVIDELPEKYIRLYERIFPNLPVAGRPLDIWENDPYMLWGMAPGEADGPHELFGLFDVKGLEPRPVTLNLDVIHARCHGWSDRPERAPEAYLLWDFWNEQLLKTDGPNLVLDRPQRDCRLFALRPDLGRPQLLGTSGHFSCGVVETRKIHWDADANCLTGAVRGNGGDATTLFLRVPRSMAPATAFLDGRAVKLRQHSPSVLVLPVPSAETSLPFELTFRGASVPTATRAFRPGPAAE